MCAKLIPLVLALCAVLAPLPAAADTAPDEFAAIDAHAVAAPASVADSVSTLSAYLTGPAQNDREKARAIFRWIAHNVAYDPSADGLRFSPTAVLRSRRAVCLGYAVLFEALAEDAGMKAELIFGHSKDLKPGTADGPDGWENHSWNAVQIDGQWRLLDCCWGAGHYDEQGAFVQSFTPHYFLTAPEDFAYDHLPTDPSWQLLDQPMSRADYLERVHVKPAFFDCGLRPVTHPSYRIDAGNSVELVIAAPPQTYLNALLYKNETPLEDHYTFAQRCAEGYRVQALFPSEGVYTLRIFARRGDATPGEYVSALDYEVRASSGQTDAVGFPLAYEAFLANQCELERPLSHSLTPRQEVEFSLTAPNAAEVIVTTGRSWHRLSAEDGRFTGTVPISLGDIYVFARFADKTTYEGLLRYSGQPSTRAAESAPHDSAGLS